MMCPTPLVIRNKADPRKFDSVPCGKCYACQTNRRTSWQIRLKEELLNSKCAAFVTLTYEEANLEFNENGIASVYKETLQKFFKRLRKKMQFRYYAVGEYGSITKRPHYHVLMFNVNERHHDMILEAWKYGQIDIGTVTLASIGYVTKYHVSRGDYPEGAEKPFTLMSRKPAIGHSYIEKMKYYHKDNLCNTYQDYEHKLALPRYYKEKIFTSIEKESLRVLSERHLLIKEFEQGVRESKDPNFFQKRANSIETKQRTFKYKSKLNRSI